MDLIATHVTPVQLSWNRRSRLASRFMATSQPALGEDTESYEVDVISPTGQVVSTIPTDTASVALNAWLPTKHLNSGYAAFLWQGQYYSGSLFGLTTLGSTPSGNQYTGLCSYDLVGTNGLTSYWQQGNDDFVFAMAPSYMFKISGTKLYISSRGTLQLFNASDFIGKFSTPPAAVAGYSPAQTTDGAFDLSSSAVWFAYGGNSGKIAKLGLTDLSVSSITPFFTTSPSVTINYGRVKYSSSNNKLYAIVSRSDVGFGVDEYDVSGSTPARTRNLPIADSFTSVNYADLIIFGSYLCVGMPDAVRFYDLATLTLVKVIASTKPSQTSSPFVGLDMFALTFDGKLAFYDASRAGVVFLTSTLAISTILATPSAAGVASLCGVTNNGVVVISGVTEDVATDKNTGSLDVYTYSDFSTGYTAVVYQMSAAVGRGFGSTPKALG